MSHAERYWLNLSPLPRVGRAREVCFCWILKRRFWTPGRSSPGVYSSEMVPRACSSPTAWTRPIIAGPTSPLLRRRAVHQKHLHASARVIDTNTSYFANRLKLATHKLKENVREINM
jgi:hypothetical protein